MPYFIVDDLNISPSEFLGVCSKKELTETFEMLQKDYGFESESDEGAERIRSESQKNFNKNLQHLKSNWVLVSKEDADIIGILGKKYGAV